eukprot:Hpha_TRINITY_DN22997_c0_g1::TRINITY_DN22997_c0_g1_i1::g.154054::m.154054
MGMYTSSNTSQNEFLGVVAADFTLGTLSSFLSDHRPTRDSVIYVVEPDGGLVASSLATTEVSYEGPEGREYYTAHDPAWSHSEVFSAIVSRLGSLQAAVDTDVSRIMHSGDKLLLVRPLTDEGLSWVLVVSIPYSDATAKATAGSYQGLLVALGVSMAAGVLLIGLASYSFQPFRKMAEQMARVANMDLDDLPPIPTSIVEEVLRLGDAYCVMLERLTYYRDCMPASLLEDSGVTLA